MSRGHDGLVDVTHASDHVTVSWNVFATHDKTLLIGNSDSATADRGHLRVTLHHNLFDNTGQRTPRVRFGRVHVYNNVYRAHVADNGDSAFRSAWGAGVESQLYAENNYFHMSAGVSPIMRNRPAETATPEMRSGSSPPETTRVRML